MKKECSIVKDLLPLYKDKVVSKETKEYIEEHLKTCQGCQKYLEDLQFKVENENEQEAGAFRKFAKKMHLKLIRNTFLGILYFIILTYCVLYFLTTYPFKIKYSKEIEGDFYDDGINPNYFFQLAAPYVGSTDGIKVEKNGVTYFFVTWKSSILNRLEDLDGRKMVDVPNNIDFRNVDLTDEIYVYYTRENLKKISSSNEKEWEKILAKSNLIFDSETKKTKIDCTLNNEKYSYTLLYYKLNDQVIEGFGGENFPSEIQIKSSSIKDGESMNMWYKGGKASDMFNRTEKYIQNKGGMCTKTEIE